MEIIFRTAPKKAKPKAGDTKMIKGVLHVRRQMIAHDHRGRAIGWVVSNGRPVFEWIEVKDEL